MENGDKSIKELMAEARAIHFAMTNGQITYEKAKLLVQPILLSVNDHVDRIAKEYKMKPKHITFYDLGRNI